MISDIKCFLSFIEGNWGNHIKKSWVIILKNGKETLKKNLHLNDYAVVFDNFLWVSS